MSDELTPVRVWDPPTRVFHWLLAACVIATTGPLIKFVTGAASLALTKWHKLFGQRLIISLIVLHVAAIMFYVFKKKHTLVRPMIAGDKALTGDVPASIDNGSTRVLALVVVALCAGLVAWVVSLGD